MHYVPHDFPLCNVLLCRLLTCCHFRTEITRNDGSNINHNLAQKVMELEQLIITSLGAGMVFSKIKAAKQQQDQLQNLIYSNALTGINSLSDRDKVKND